MFKKGQRVKYIPNHAEGDKHRPDYEKGAISSVCDDRDIFVKHDSTN